ncbi:hypothetical protein QFC19_000590 [Naganishia cerealis]|uniref:Uncharacterized protein n=1 Tax=Naganishia cerealis TaxID=610337 RepID=A0ACC2WM75_9TREE|nr:hypothetical protein QFC19_000590 [Naganishia cerealis]
MPLKHAETFLSVSPNTSITSGSESRRMSSTLRQSVTARRVSHGGTVTTLFTEETAAENNSASKSLHVSASADTSRRPSAANSPIKSKVGRNLNQSEIIPQSKVAGTLLSMEMARSTSMPSLTQREIDANSAKDADLGLSRGDSFIWMDDNSLSDQEDDLALITPPESKALASGSFAGAQAQFFGNSWDQHERPLFANPFDSFVHCKSSLRHESNQAPDETSPGKHASPELRLPDVSGDPPSPTRRRPSLLRYRRLNIVFPTFESPYRVPWTGETDSSASSIHSATKPFADGQRYPVLMRRSVEETEQTLVNLLPRLSSTPSFMVASKRPSVSNFDPLDGAAGEIKGQSFASRRGSWAQASFVDFSPPVVTLGREYRSRFNSVDSAMTRNSDAGSLFGSVHGSDWMKSYLPKKEEWARRSTDWSNTSIRRGSDPNARRHSSLKRTAHANASLNRQSSGSAGLPPSEGHFYSQTYRDTANPGPSRGFRFGSAVSHLSNIVSPEKALQEEDEGPDEQDWQIRRGSWCEV